MDKKILLGIAVAFLIILLLVISLSTEFFEIANNVTEKDIEIIEFRTDKDTYSSRENVEISIKITSSEDRQVTAKIKGIQPLNRPHIESSKKVDIGEGENKINFNEKTPYCTSGCGGVSPGEYNLDIEILDGEEIIVNSTTTINLVS